MTHLVVGKKKTHFCVVQTHSYFIYVWVQCSKGMHWSQLRCLFPSPDPTHSSTISWAPEVEMCCQASLPRSCKEGGWDEQWKTALSFHASPVNAKCFILQRVLLQVTTEMFAESESGCTGSTRKIKAVTWDGKIGDKEAVGLWLTYL